MKKTSILLGLLLLASIATAQNTQIPLAPDAIPEFVQPLPTLSLPPQNGTVNTILGNTAINLRMCEFRANILPPGAVPNYQGTWVWGYLVDPTGTSTCAQLIQQYGGVTGVLDTSIGPVIVNQRGTPTAINYVNDLGSAATTNVIAWKSSTDQTLHWANPLNLMCMGMVPEPFSPCSRNYEGPIPVVPHLHGGEVPPELDGGPDSWYTSNGILGPRYYSAGAATNAALYKYPNRQEAAPIWFHDHALGATRLNVYAGMAGAYYIYDPALDLPSNLTALNEVIPIAIQDRQFDTNGQLLFQAGLNGGVLWALNPEHPYWSPEFVGDTIMINGKVWPFLNVEPKRYRFLFLNGSNARSYEMFLTNRKTKVNGPSMYVIGTDGGYLDAPVLIDPNALKPALTKLVMMPGERYEVIIDFSGQLPGTSLVLKNVAKTPFPNGAAPDGTTLGQLMEFRVGPCTSQCGPADPSYNPATGQPLRTGSQQIVRLANPATGTLAPGVTPQLTRQLTLNEVMGMPMMAPNPIDGIPTQYPGGPLEVLLNNTKWSGESTRPYNDFTPVSVGGMMTFFSEIPQEGDTEVWEIVNLTADAHPIHLHLVQFQLMNRQAFDFPKYNAVYNASFPGGLYIPAFGPPQHYNAATNPNSGGKFGGNPDVARYLKGVARPPAVNEAGWKDTVIAYPGEVTRIAVRWAPTELPISAPADTRYYPFDPNGEGGQFSYVWHCHIIDHEDNEMMRPDFVTLNPVAPVPAARPLRKGVDY